VVRRRFSWCFDPDLKCVDAVAWIDSPSVLTDAVTRVKDVRALGLDVGVDFHGRLHKGMAKQLVKLLEPHQPFFIEGGVNN
jgi:galactonate dehydratase